MKRQWEKVRSRVGGGRDSENQQRLPPDSFSPNGREIWDPTYENPTLYRCFLHIYEMSYGNERFTVLRFTWLLFLLTLVMLRCSAGRWKEQTGGRDSGIPELDLFCGESFSIDPFGLPLDSNPKHPPRISPPFLLLGCVCRVWKISNNGKKRLGVCAYFDKKCCSK